MTDTHSTDFIHARACSAHGVQFEARQSGLYRSDDGGQSWQFAFSSLNLPDPLPCTALALSPDFAVDGRVFAGVSGGVLLSSDGGQSWSYQAFAAPPPVITALLVSPDFTRDRILLAGTLEDGVFLSFDAGVSWSAWNFGLLDWRVYALALSPDYAQDRTVYAGTETGLYRSTNCGRGWHELPFPAQTGSINHIRIDRLPDHGLILQVETESGASYQSSDHGQSWAPVTGPQN